jgi:arylsulfatase A-like enzyme
MGDHTRPLTAFDPMIHVPLIFHYPGKIDVGKRAEILISNYDFYPSLLEYLGLKKQIPSNPPLPGRSYADTLRGKSERNWDDTIFFEYENTRAIRTNDWKLITRFPDGPNELYHLSDDPQERDNVIDEPQRADVQSDLQTRLEAFFSKFVDPKYDLARGGKSKANRRLP